jgi:hypothetical protein
MRWIMGVIAALLVSVAPAAVAAGPPQQIAYTSSTSDGSSRSVTKGG